MAPTRARVYGWRLGLLLFLAGGILGPILLFAFGGDGRAGYAVYAAVAAGALLGLVALLLLRRLKGREDGREREV